MSKSNGERERLARERELRQRAATTELTEKERDYVLQCQAKTERFLLKLSPLDRASLEVMAELNNTDMTKYLLACHRAAVHHLRTSRDSLQVAAFDLEVEKRFGRITGQRTLVDIDDEQTQKGTAA